MSDIVRFIEIYENNENLHILLSKRKKLQSEIDAIENEIYSSCDHKWVSEVIEIPYSYKTKQVTYCRICEMNKRVL